MSSPPPFIRSHSFSDLRSLKASQNLNNMEYYLPPPEESDFDEEVIFDIPTAQRRIQRDPNWKPFNVLRFSKKDGSRMWKKYRSTSVMAGLFAVVMLGLVVYGCYYYLYKRRKEPAGDIESAPSSDMTSESVGTEADARQAEASTEPTESAEPASDQ